MGIKTFVIMDYEQKYKDALERARALHDLFITQGHDGKAEILDGIFSELKESEDEKIRKAIIAYIDHGQHNGVSNKDMIAWLDKQRHMLDPDKVIEWLEDNQRFVWVVDKFKKDFEL